MLRLKWFKVKSHFLLEKQNVSFKKVTLKILVWDLASYLVQYLQQKQNFCQKLSIVGTYAVIYLEKEYVREYFFFCKMWQSLDQKFKMKMKGIEWNGIFYFFIWSQRCHMNPPTASPGRPQCRPPCTPGGCSRRSTSSSTRPAPPALSRHWPEQQHKSGVRFW